MILEWCLTRFLDDCLFCWPVLFKFWLDFTITYTPIHRISWNNFPWTPALIREASQCAGVPKGSDQRGWNMVGMLSSKGAIFDDNRIRGGLACPAEENILFAFWIHFGDLFDVFLRRFSLSVLTRFLMDFASKMEPKIIKKTYVCHFWRCSFPRLYFGWYFGWSWHAKTFKNHSKTLCFWAFSTSWKSDKK